MKTETKQGSKGRKRKIENSGNSTLKLATLVVRG